MAWWISKRERALEERLMRSELRLKQMDTELEVKQAKYQLEHDKKTADIERLALDQASLTEREHKATIEKLKLDKEQVVNEVKIKSDKLVMEAEAEADKRVNENHQKLNTEFYDKLKSELAKLHSEGNAQTQFVQEAAMKLLDKAGTIVPTSKVAIEHKTIDVKGKVDLKNE